MASYYVRSGAGGAATGADWANAYLTMTAAIAAKAAGDIFYVSEDHSETTAGAVTLSFPGTLASPNLVYCVNHAGSVPPVSADLTTGGSVATSGNSAITINSTVYFRGLTFNAGSGANNPSLTLQNNGGHYSSFDTCTLKLGGTTGGNVVFGTFNAQSFLTNTTVQVASTASVISPGGGYLTWTNTASALQGATIPTTLFTGASVGNMKMVGVDLSALGSGKSVISGNSGSGAILFTDCKLGASVTASSTPTNDAVKVDFIHCDSGATNYRTERYAYQGTQTTETTIVRTGGASDGTTPISWKLVSTANSKWVKPYESIPTSIWNDSTSAITTLTIYGTTTGGGVPNNDDIWVEVEYLGSALTPQGSFITTTKANNLAPSASTNNSTDASTWGGGGAGNGFKIVVPSFTPGMKGLINITVKVAKASSTYYIDPRPSISGVTVSKSETLAPGVYANELSSGSGNSSSSIIGG